MTKDHNAQIKEMPEEIYAEYTPEADYTKLWYHTKGMGTKYIRADLVEKMKDGS